VILDEAKRQALAIVPESQLSLAIGKQGLNVRLANRLVDWSIDVKTEMQYADMDISSESKRAVSELFGDDQYEEEIARISELPDVNQDAAKALLENGVEYIEDFLALSEEQLAGLRGITAEQLGTLRSLIDENVEIVEEGEYAEEEAPVETEAEPTEEDAEAEEFDCPECGAKITVDMTVCPNCGIGLSFEYEDEE
jgi:N utilization substance protein A